MIVLGITFLGLQTFWAFVRPKYFFFTYLLFLSSFLGFFSKSIVIGGNEVGLFYHSVLMLGSYILYFKRLRDYPRSIKLVLHTISLLYLYGLIYPVLNGSSSLIQSVIASKEFSTLFLLHYLLVHRRAFSMKYINKVLSFFGYAFLLILLLFVFYSYIPPEYIKRPGQMEYDYPAFLSLFLYIKAGQAKTPFKKIVTIFLLMIWTVGMYFEDHTAIMLTTLLGCTIITFRIPLIKFTKNYKYMFAGFGLLVTLLLIIPIDPYVDRLLQTPSFQARARYNIERFELIKEKPLQGYGFLHKTAYDLEGSSIYTESLSFIDSGYVDLLGKFGFVGMVLYLSILAIFFFHQQGNMILTSMKVFLLQYFAINVTWSVFSFTIGTIALSIAIFIYFLNCSDRKELRFQTA